jgi:hypothetical protein
MLDRDLGGYVGIRSIAKKLAFVPLGIQSQRSAMRGDGFPGLGGVPMPST